MPDGLALTAGSGWRPGALPPATHMVDADAVRRLAEAMTPKTWRRTRAKLLALTAKEG